ncbi:HD domain-containing protein [Curtobacterium sp. VKM Ac-2922]|uniref:HD domain-containing protein n=1 Tax=Curtobacterium sp. VKM Ac-2922 TaxID=2929475 RepID=UPI001FB2730E|nr:HD domain-containing protein [Curtobacterium sp. VKM Ac-2922]MCJ1715493.1 HD domain-containing protein [Curtobacterium sp. VKM Ac-2922]
MHGDAADTMGIDGVWYDPLWRIEVPLTPVERALLATWPVRRLAFIAHAGAAAITTTQNYSRLEHSLGVLALVAHFAPDDAVARATALLHDVGHLPYSHTLEGIGGLDHHTLGRAAVRQLDPVLRAGGLDAQIVIDTDDGARWSPLTSRRGGLKLDHLDSFLRSGQANGRTTTPPADLLRRLRLIDGAVDTDVVTADEITHLAFAEARAQRSEANIIPNAVMRDLVRRACAAGVLTPDVLATMTDDALWALLSTAPTTAAGARALRRHPERWRMRAGRSTSADALTHVVRRTYLDLPTVDGRTVHADDADALRRDVPLALVVERRTA